MEESLIAEKGKVARLECECATEAKKRQQLFAEHREKNQIASRPPVDRGDSLNAPQATMTAKAVERNKWREPAAGVEEELKVAQVDGALQSTL